MTIEQKRQKLEQQLAELARQEEEKANFYDNAKSDIDNAVENFIVIYSKAEDKNFRIAMRRVIKYLIRAFVKERYDVETMENDFNKFVRLFISSKINALVQEETGVNDNE